MKLHFLLSAFMASSPFASGSKHASLEEPFQDSFKKLQHSPCVSLFYRNGRAGCGTQDREPQSGPLFYYDGSSSPPNYMDYVAVIEEYMLRSKTVNNLVASSGDYLKGILVLNSTYANAETSYSSPGPTYPLGYSTPSADISYGNIQYPWNGKGDGLTQDDLWGVPMAYVKEGDASSYIRESAKDTDEAVTIHTTFNYYMGQDDVYSEECLAWKDAADGEWNPKCLPLGGTSVWAHAGSPPVDYEQSYGRKLEEDDADSKQSILLATSIDSTSMFHDLVPGANEGATNTLTLLMAAYLIGISLPDSTLDNFNKRIVFGFFEGEAYGYLGSRKFIDDLINFECDDQYTVNSVSNDKNSDKACLSPMRPSLAFKNLGEIAGMVTVDQVGVPAGDKSLFVHNDGSDETGAFLANLLTYTGTSYYTAVASEANNQNEGGDYPYPPTPLTTLMALTEGNVGGAVLTGYDYAFTKRPPYQSHLSLLHNTAIDYKAVASAATMLARTAVAAAYDDGDMDYEDSGDYALKVIPQLSYDNDILVELADCLYSNGNCQMLKKYSSMEASTERRRNGIDITNGESLGNPPNYYVGVYKAEYGQPFVKVGDKYYGAYTGDEYGEKSSDAVGMQPRMLQQAMRNMLHDFLGRGSSDDGKLRSCKASSDCSGVNYCAEPGDKKVCSGSHKCVCSRAYYHIALDEAIEPATNTTTGYFVVSDDDNGVSPMWTEPFWSSDVSVKMYRVAAKTPGFLTLAAGGVAVVVCFFITVLVKVGMKKEKVY